MIEFPAQPLRACYFGRKIRGEYVIPRVGCFFVTTFYQTNGRNSGAKLSEFLQRASYFGARVHG